MITTTPKVSWNPILWTRLAVTHDHQREVLGLEPGSISLLRRPCFLKDTTMPLCPQRRDFKNLTGKMRSFTSWQKGQTSHQGGYSYGYKLRRSPIKGTLWENGSKQAPPHSVRIQPMPCFYRTRSWAGNEPANTPLTFHRK